MNKELDMIELENGVRLAVIDAINYDNRTFVLLSKLNESLDDMEDEMLVYEKLNDKIATIEDNDLLEKLMRTFENRLKK